MESQRFQRVVFWNHPDVSPSTVNNHTSMFGPGWSLPNSSGSHHPEIWELHLIHVPHSLVAARLWAFLYASLHFSLHFSCSDRVWKLPNPTLTPEINVSHLLFSWSNEGRGHTRPLGVCRLLTFKLQFLKKAWSQFQNMKSKLINKKHQQSSNQ